jgi:hypothetical protein
MKERGKQLEGSGIAVIAGGVALGMAIWNLAGALVSDVITPLIAAFISESPFQLNTFTFRGSQFPYALFIEDVLAVAVEGHLWAVACTTLGEQLRSGVGRAPSRITGWWFRTEKDEDS